MQFLALNKDLPIEPICHEMTDSYSTDGTGACLLTVFELKIMWYYW